MNRSIPISFHAFCLWRLNAGIIVFLSAFCAVALDLPAPFAMPDLPAMELPKPGASPHGCSTCGNDDRPRIEYRDFVGQRIPVDFYAPRWTRDIFVVEVGYQRPWQPAAAYALYPYGPQGQPDIAQLIMRDDIVVFKRKIAEDGTSLMECVSHQNWRMARNGDFIVVERIGDCALWFSSPDFGATWRLEKLEPIACPSFGVTLRYDNNALAAVVYPDKAEAVLRYRGETLTHVEFPNGYVASFGHDAAGYIDRLEITAPDDTVVPPEIVGFTMEKKDGVLRKKVHYKQAEPLPPKTIRFYLYENDAKGRIVRYVAPCGQEYRIDYAVSSNSAPHYVVTMTHVATGDYEFMIENEDGPVWAFERGFGEAGQPIEAARVSERRVKRKSGFHMATETLELGDDLGRPELLAGGGKGGTPVKRPAGKPVASRAVPPPHTACRPPFSTSLPIRRARLSGLRQGRQSRV